MHAFMNEYPGSSFRLTMATAILLLASTFAVDAQTTQEHVHQMAHSVMPFEIGKTVHIFKMTESGGVQQVIVKDAGATDQIALIRQHLEHEAMKFQHGDYSDPAALHGVDMPGLEELRAGAAAIEVSYKALPAGAEITFETSDLHLITAIHRWFGAQLSEHGSDARAE